MKLYKPAVWKECSHCGRTELESYEIIGCDNCGKSLELDLAKKISSTIFYEGASRTEDFYFCCIECWLVFMIKLEKEHREFQFMNLPYLEPDQLKEFVDNILEGI